MEALSWNVVVRPLDTPYPVLSSFIFMAPSLLEIEKVLEIQFHISQLLVIDSSELTRDFP
jgi:hypothetical protein